MPILRNNSYKWRFEGFWIEREVFLSKIRRFEAPWNCEINCKMLWLSFLTCVVKRMSKDPAKQKATSLWNKSFAIHTKIGGKDWEVWKGNWGKVLQMLNMRCFLCSPLFSEISHDNTCRRKNIQLLKLPKIVCSWFTS